MEWFGSIAGNYMLCPTKVLLMVVKPRKYTEVLTLKISPTQAETLSKLRSYNVPVSKFVREAIKEKINREHENLKPKPKDDYYSF